MWLRSTISLISKDAQAPKTLILLNGTPSGAPSCSFSSLSAAGEEGNDVRNLNFSAAESMQGLAQTRSRGLDFELQDYVQISASLPAPLPSTSSPQPRVKDETENFFSRTWANIKKAQHSGSLSLSSSSSSSSTSNKPRIRQKPQDSRSDLSVQSDSAALRDLSPHPRVWQRALHAGNEKESFVVTSFNILASTYAEQHRSLYPYVPDVLLSWGSRKKRILQELDFASPDIICLQEVDRFRDLAEDLTLRGYVGLFKLRTGAMPDGCAIFWRKARFKLLQERSFEFSMLGMRNNVAQLCVLEPVGPGTANSRSPLSRVTESTQNRRLVVGNIHVLFNPKRGEIKLGQCRAFLEQVHNMSSVWQGAPVVIGGDFNSTPSSAVYRFLATSTLDLSNSDRRYLSGQAVETALDCKMLSRRALLQKEILEETHRNSSRTHVITQVEESEVALNDKKAGELFTNVSSKLSSEYRREAANDDLEGCCKSDGISTDSSVQRTEIKFKESHFSASSGSELLVTEAQSLSITESNILQGNGWQPVHSHDTEFSKTPCNDSSKSSLTVDRSDEDEGVREKSKWELEELRIATGRVDCTVMHHKLNLCSVYTEVPGQPNTRDTLGEPLVTTCHKEFTGTVDYIWRSDGLKTVKVLDTVPLNTFARNKGLALKLWGSDHLPISCELMFDQNCAGI